MEVKSAVAIGTFDGVHLGHRLILEKVVRTARSRRLIPTALVFERPPRDVLAGRPTALLTPPRERKKILRRMGIRRIVWMRFTRRFSRQSPSVFFHRHLRRRLNARFIACGRNFRFGRFASGTPETLRRLGRPFGIQVACLPAGRLHGRPVSSTRIRRLLREGKVEEANRMLGRPYEISGTVVRGSGRGRALGFPTANLRTHPAQLLPPGVFACRVEEKMAAANIGTAPTFRRKGLRPRPVVEVHLLRPPRRTLLGKVLRIRLLRRLRPERRFPSPAALARQIRLDIARARRCLAV